MDKFSTPNESVTLGSPTSQQHAPSVPDQSISSLLHSMEHNEGSPFDCTDTGLHTPTVRECHEKPLVVENFGHFNPSHIRTSTFDQQKEETPTILDKIKVYDVEILKQCHISSSNLNQNSGETVSTNVTSSFSRERDAPSATCPSIKTIAIRSCETASICPQVVTNNSSKPVTEAAWVQLQNNRRESDHGSPMGCKLCINYEHQLQTLQKSQQVKDKNLRDLGQELTAKSLQLKEVLRKKNHLESELNSRSTAHRKRIETLESSICRFSTRLEDLFREYHAYRSRVDEQFRLLVDDHLKVLDQHKLLQSHYDSLVGRRAKAVAELSEQPIQLPSDKTELELLALRLYEENLSMRAAREHLDERLQDETEFNHQRLKAERSEHENKEKTLQRELDDANIRLASLSDIINQRDKEVAARLKADEDAHMMRMQIDHLQAKVDQAENQAAELRAEVVTLQQRMACLQADLDNAESVQADFVRLSQNLQVQLERFRQQEHELRWVDPEDVSICFACNAPFPTGTGTTHKRNCRHCGKVHCQSCLKNTVLTAASSRPSQVCDVCFTLLNKHVAPYFSIGFSDAEIGAPSLGQGPSLRRDSSTEQIRSPIAENLKM